LSLGNRCQDGEIMNSIFVIKPYKFEGQWVFDDERVGLFREPFVGGADAILDVMTAHIMDADNGFVAMFSASWFPGTMAFDWVRHEGDGDVYHWSGGGMEGWLCPALLRYFEKAPKRLYVRVKPRE
jgi:hypothetical protein